MLQKTILIFLTIPVLFIPACAQNKTFVSSEGKFSIDLHSTPNEDKNSAEARLGGKKLWWRTQRATFMVSYALNPDAKKEDAEQAAERSADGYISAIPKAAEIVSRKKITIDGYPGVEVVSREKDGFTVINRYYMVETRIYAVMAMWAAGPNDKEVLRTLDSFKIATAAQSN